MCLCVVVKSNADAFICFRLLQELRDKVRPMVQETVSYLHKMTQLGKCIVVEGAQSTILDIDFGNVDDAVCLLLCLFVCTFSSTHHRINKLLTLS